MSCIPYLIEYLLAYLLLIAVISKYKTDGVLHFYLYNSVLHGVCFRIFRRRICLNGCMHQIVSFLCFIHGKELIHIPCRIIIGTVPLINLVFHLWAHIIQDIWHLSLSDHSRIVEIRHCHCHFFSKRVHAFLYFFWSQAFYLCEMYLHNRKTFQFFYLHKSVNDCLYIVRF